MNEDKVIVYKKIINNKKVSFQCIESLSKQAEFLLDLISKEEQFINALKDNYTIQIGWSIYTIKEHEGDYTVLSPDFRKNPFQDTTTDLTTSLLIQVQQNEVLKNAKVQGEPISFQDTLIVHKDALNSDLLYLERKEKCEKGDSGWYIGLLDDPNDSRSIEDYKAFYVFELLALKPELVQLLSLPIGCIAIINGDIIVKVVDSENNPIL